MRANDVKVHAWDIISSIPDEELARLGKESNVNYCTKVLTGERVFYLLLYALLASMNVSQRYLAELFKNKHFQTLFNLAEGSTVTHGSISPRLAKMDLGFFQKAYELIYKRLSSLYTEKEMASHYLVPVDSSMVAEACNKLKHGMSVGKTPSDGSPSRKQFKFTMACRDFIPEWCQAFFAQTFLSGDMAMPAVISHMIKQDADHRNCYLLDRGQSALRNYRFLDQLDAKFVARIKTNRKMEVVDSLMDEDTDRDLGKLRLKEDLIVRLYDSEKRKFSDETFRLIKAEFKERRDTTRPADKGKVRRVENDVYFITNEYGMSAREVAEAYRRRWDIEVFFKFLKQNMCFSHFLSVNDNGIQIVMYMTLIAYMLIMIYKRENEKLYNGERGFWFSNAKFCFWLEICDWVTELTVLLKGGVPDCKHGNVILRTRIP